MYALNVTKYTVKYALKSLILVIVEIGVHNSRFETCDEVVALSSVVDFLILKITYLPNYSISYFDGKTMYLFKNLPLPLMTFRFSTRSVDR